MQPSVPDIAVRSATLADSRAIYDLIRSYPDELITRPLADIARNIDRFTVVTLGGDLVGCASYTILPEAGNFSAASVELTSVAIRPDLRSHGLGRTLVNAAIERIRAFRPSQVFVLTCTPAFFERMGFHEIPKTSVLHKIYTGCMNCMKHSNPFTCPEVAMATPGEAAETIHQPGTRTQGTP